MLDYSFFKQIGLFSDKSLIKFFTLFLESVPLYLSQLEKALELGDMVTFREINHKLKPNLLYFRNPELESLIPYISSTQPIDVIRSYFPLLKEQLLLIIHQVEEEKDRLQNEQ